MWILDVVGFEEEPNSHTHTHTKHTYAMNANDNA